ncbi:cytochrome oxidase biogenesis protein Sco1/SenC/PrrC, putative copper metallochaperone [Geomicrobium sp. JCM 19055]|nr:cytochrome oxidase biogenesis protein Sco1/SenC/PrrC, putative copper metallochaperone [Geomicrobium sp. JCM 19055]
MEIQEKAESRNLDLQFVSFTVDPNHDTPDVLTDYMDRYGVDQSNWQFLTGYSEKEIETLMLDSFQSTVLNDPEDPDILHTTNFFSN